MDAGVQELLQLNVQLSWRERRLHNNSLEQSLADSLSALPSLCVTIAFDANSRGLAGELHGSAGRTIARFFVWSVLLVEYGRQV